MPLRSPLNTAGAWRTRLVLPPSTKFRPASTRLSGRAARWCANVSSAARRFASTICRETGMYLVAPLVVPDVTAK